MKQPEQPSAFVKRCQDALAEYQRLRFLGAGHEVAARQLQDALKPQTWTADNRMKQTGDANAD